MSFKFISIVSLAVLSLTCLIQQSHQHTMITTADKLGYAVFHRTQHYLNFKVRAPRDAHIQLRKSLNGTKYDLYLGTEGNTKSTLYIDDKPALNVLTPGILSPYELRGFWIKWISNGIFVGKQGETDPFMEKGFDQNVDIRIVGFSTGLHVGYGTPNTQMGTWLLNEQ